MTSDLITAAKAEPDPSPSLAFKKWTEAHPANWNLGAMWNDGKFVQFMDPDTDTAWLGFSAGWAAARTRVPELIAALEAAEAENAKLKRDLIATKKARPAGSVADELNARHISYMTAKGRDPNNYISQFSLARDAILEALRAHAQSFTDACDGRASPPMACELMTAGLSSSDADFVAGQLAQNGLILVTKTDQAKLLAALERSKRLRDQYRAALDAERDHSNPARAILGEKP